MTKDLEKTVEALKEQSKTASLRAYCPYSRFPVGAAIVSESGAVFVACNVENASYGLTMCAERNAVFQMVASGEKNIKAVVVYTPTPIPSSPCGACRQVINEFGPGALIVSVCDGPDELRTTLGDLLPEAFGPRNLK